MGEMTRRALLGKTLAAGAAISGLGMIKSSVVSGGVRKAKDDISLQEWALVDEIKAGKWTNLDFPRIAREEFGIGGVEFVNTLFEVPIYNYLRELKKNAAEHGVEMLLIMCDGEGEMASDSKKERKQAVINHHKWIDIAHYLGCHSIRTNCYGPEEASKEEALNRAEESYNELLEYAVQAKVSVLIENHGGISNDADFLVSLMERVNSLYFGMLPDFRRPSAEFDNYGFLEKVLPYAGAMSVRTQPTEEGLVKMIELCRDSGYKGYYGIETSGREGIRETKRVLEKVLFGKG
ncbi:MAG: sugar phosphate isomerase/epimerase family protein [Planctomycetota bacterium]